METDKQRHNSFDWLKAYQWQKGQSGNPAGRPKTKTLKEFARDFLSNLSDEDRLEYFKHVNPTEVWKMAEGGAPQSTDITSGGEKLIINIVAFKGDSISKETNS